VIVSSSDTKAVLLVGGLGTRLRPVVPSAPKPLARIGDRPFLQLLVRQLASQGLRRLVMCTGYLGDQIEHEFGDGTDFDVKIEYSQEPQALGTAGAVKFAQRYLETLPYFLVTNGDSFLDIDFNCLIHAHRLRKALATIAVLPVNNSGRYGTVRIDPSNNVLEFCEKTGQDLPGLINGGVYVFSSAILDHIPGGQVSLERDVFPQILSQGVYAVKQEGMFIDIGTPADYANAQLLLER